MPRRATLRTDEISVITVASGLADETTGDVFSRLVVHNKNSLNTFIEASHLSASDVHRLKLATRLVTSPEIPLPIYYNNREIIITEFK